MIRPFSEEEKKAALRDGVEGALAEARRREPQMREIRETAKKMWAQLLAAETLHIVDAPIPHGITPRPEELWSVTPKVTTE
jgi:hypothetical protein